MPVVVVVLTFESIFGGWQSLFCVQPWPGAHATQWLPLLAPPQSTPDSLPFFTPSLHEGATHLPPVQTLLTQ